KNVLRAAALSAITSAITYGIASQARVSESSEREAEGSGGSGSARAEAVRRFAEARARIQEALDMAEYETQHTGNYGTVNVLRQLAVEYAASALGLQLPAGWSFEYDPVLGTYDFQGLTENQVISIGNGALRSAAYLGSTLIHEYTHLTEIV